MPTSSPLHRLMLCTLPALLLATLAGSLAQQLHMPLPWMIGPLFCIARLRVVLLTVCAPLLCRHFLAWQARSTQHHSGDQA